MRRLLVGILLLCLTAGSARCLLAEDNPNPKAIILKAIQAMGGEEKLALYKGNVSKGRCKFYGNGEAIDCVGEWYMQPPRQLKAVYHMDRGDKKVTRIEVVSGDQGWISNGGKTRPLSAEQLAEIQEGMAAELVATLLPLKDPAYQLTSLGDSEVQKRPVTGIKVSRQGHRDVLLYFDKEHGYLLKMQTRVKDLRGSEVDQEMLYSDYQDFDGVRSYKKLTTNRGGKLFLEWEATEYKAVEKLPDSVFEKPDVKNVSNPSAKPE
jgi:hypothetical protein